MALHTYIPQDRLAALAQGADLADRTSGAALFADISGFTALTEKLRAERGERRGIEELSQRVNEVYDALISEVEAFGGSVISFAGDAITCWFDATGGPAPLRAGHAARSMQVAMTRFAGLSVKVAVTSGPARRLVVGDPDIQLLDVIAGATISRVATAEGLATPGEVLLDDTTAAALGQRGLVTRLSSAGERFHLLAPECALPAAERLDESPGAWRLNPSLLKPWVLPFVFEREQAGQGLFVTDLRPATALFMRFSGLDYDHDESAARHLGELVASAQQTLQQQGGVLLELIVGDKGSYLYGSFGAAQVHEDDAARALRAALALKALFADTPYPVQLGLSSGTLRVGGYGARSRQSFGAMGDEVNTAARLMGAARAGEILISGRVRQVLADEFVLEARPALPMKGKAEPAPVFVVLGEVHKRARRLQEPASAMPMVGREAEMEVFAAALADALQGRGRVLGVQADAGMGKSRLVAEALRVARRRGFLTYGGACQLDGARTPYLVWLPIWSALLEADPDLPQRRQVRAVELALEEHASEYAESRPLLGAVLGLDWPDNAFTATLLPKDRKALLEAVLLQVLSSAAREAALDGMAVMLVLEDLHAADPLSADLLLVVARAVQDLPVLVVLTYRPVDGGPAHDALAQLATLPCFDQIEPGAIDAQQSEQLIRAKLASLYPERKDSVPAALIERVTNRAQGNPFFVEELLNYLHDRGIDPRDTAAMQSLDLPASLHGLVLSRIDQLLLQLQLTLKVASIIGRVFRVSDLSDYHPMLGAPERVRQQVHQLARLGFTPPDPADPELTHLFKHLVTQEVAYESIAFSTRVQLHGLYADFLELRYADRLGALAPQLAHHYACAARHDKACIYLRKAGEQAAARYANEEALDCFARALKWLPVQAAADRYAVVLQREAVLALRGQHADRRADLAEADRLADQLEDPVDAHAEVAVRRAQLEMDTGDFAGARVWAQAAIMALERSEKGAGRLPLRLVDALHQEARALFFMGKSADARPQLHRALALARESSYPRGEYSILSMLGLLHWHAGDYAAADELLNQAVNLIDQVGDPRQQLDVLNNLGVVAKTRGRPAQALLHYSAAQAIARRIGDRSGEAMLLNNRGEVFLELGDHFQAGVFTDQAARMFGEVQEPVSRGHALLNRAEAHRGLGQYAAAAALAEQALTLLRAGQHRLGEAVLLDNLGLVALAQGQPEEARGLATQALALVREMESHGLQSGILCHLGRACTAAGAWSAAAAALDEAASLAAGVTEGVAWLELRAAQVDLVLARGQRVEGPHAVQQLADILAILLDDAAELAQWLPLWVHEAAYRALLTQDDPRAGSVLARARRELQRRCDRIPDAAARRDFMAVAEHQALLRAAAPTR